MYTEREYRCIQRERERERVIILYSYKHYTLVILTSYKLMLSVNLTFCQMLCTCKNSLPTCEGRFVLTFRLQKKTIQNILTE